MKRKNDDECPICGEFMDVIHSGYHSEPFIDGQTYDYICFTCASVYNRLEDRFYTLEEMMDDNYKKKKIEKSLKAVKASVKRKK